VTDSAAGWGGLRDGVDRLAGDRVDEGVDARLDRDRLLDGGGGDGSHLLLGGEGRLHHVLNAGDDADLPLDDARDGGGCRGVGIGVDAFLPCGHLRLEGGGNQFGVAGLPRCGPRPHLGDRVAGGRVGRGLGGGALRSHSISCNSMESALSERDSWSSTY